MKTNHENTRQTDSNDLSLYLNLLYDTVTAEATTPPSPRHPPPQQYPPASPTGFPPYWEGEAPKFQPASPDHPPPGWATGGGINEGNVDGSFIPRSPTSPPVDDGYIPRSPTTPPPDDADSDEDDIYDRALAKARSAVQSAVWDAFSPEEKKVCIEKEMKMIEAAQGSPRL